MEEEKKMGSRGSFKGLTDKFKSFFTQEYFHRPIAIWLLIASGLLNLTSWAILWLFIKPIDLPIILHYNVYFGVDSLGRWSQVYIMPFIGLALLLVNLFLSLHFYRGKERIASYLLLMAALMIQASLLVASIGIIIINY